MMIVFCLVGIVMSIVTCASLGSSELTKKAAFPAFLTVFIGTLAIASVWGFFLEFGRNVEDWLEKIFRNNAGLEQLPETPDFITAAISKIADAANSASRQPAAMPVQQPYAQQSAPAPVAQPAPVPAPQPAPAPVAQPTPVPTPQPASVPTPQQSDGWTCSCGTSNNSAATFCKGCGKPRS